MTLRIITILALVLSAGAAQAQYGCGFVPFKPFPPLGCRDLIPRCICTSTGDCHWEWECVPR